MKKTWRIINGTLGKTNQKNNLPMFNEHNNTLITDPNIIANAFNDYFANIGSDLASNICADRNNEMYKQYLLTQSQCTCKFEKIHKDDILKIIKKMDNKRSSIYDMFSNKIIKAIIYIYIYIYICILIIAIFYQNNNMDFARNILQNWQLLNWSTT